MENITTIILASIALSLNAFSIGYAKGKKDERSEKYDNQRQWK